MIVGFAARTWFSCATPEIVTDRLTEASLAATDTSKITATVATLAASVAIGQVGVGASIGASLARNYIGYRPTGGLFDDDGPVPRSCRPSRRNVGHSRSY